MCGQGGEGFLICHSAVAQDTQGCPECSCPWRGTTESAPALTHWSTQSALAGGGRGHRECSSLWRGATEGAPAPTHWTTRVPLPVEEGTTEIAPTQDTGLLGGSQPMEGGDHQDYSHQHCSHQHCSHRGHVRLPRVTRGGPQGVLLQRTYKFAQTGPDRGGGSTESAPTQHTGLPTTPCPGRRGPLRILLPEMNTHLEVNRTDNYPRLPSKKWASPSMFDRIQCATERWQTHCREWCSSI